MRRAVLLVAVALCAGACGGEVSKAQFAARANAVCVEANRAARRLGPEPRILTARHARWILALTHRDRAAVARLRSLRQPRRAADVRRMLSAFDRGLALGPAVARASRAGDDAAFRAVVKRALDLITTGQLAAARYPLAACTHLGAVTGR